MFKIATTGEAMTQDVQPAGVSVGFIGLHPHRSASSRKQRRTAASWIGMALVLLFAAAWAGNAMSSPEAKAILKAKSCGTCHVIPGVEGAYGKFGPSLKGLRDRARILGGTMKYSTKNMEKWLKNPKALKPDTMMPNTGLSDEEIEILIQFFNAN
jgi:cytochrome c2